MLWFLNILPEGATTKEQVDLEAAFEAHGLWLLQVTTRLVGSTTHAEDLVQDAFLVLHQKGGSLEDVDDLRGWLYGVMKNLVMHHRRTIARQIRLAEKAGHQPQETPDAPPETIARRQAGARVQRAVATLGLKHREVFVLFELQGVSGDEIAQLVGIPIGTVWTRLHHARAAFEKAYTRMERAEGSV